MIPNATEVPKWLRPGYEHRVKKTLHTYRAALATACDENTCLNVPGLRWLREALESHLAYVPEHVIACTRLDIQARTPLAGKKFHWVVNGYDNTAWLYNDLACADEKLLRWSMEFTEDDDYSEQRPQFAILGFELTEFFLKWRINDQRWLGLVAQVYSQAVQAGFAHEAVETYRTIKLNGVHRALLLRSGKLRLTLTVYPEVVLRNQERMFYLFRKWERENGDT